MALVYALSKNIFTYLESYDGKDFGADDQIETIGLTFAEHN